MIKFKVVTAHSMEKPAYAETIPRIGEELFMTERGERIRVTVYNVLHDLDQKSTKVFVR